MAHPHTVPFLERVTIRLSGVGSRNLVSTPDLEIENADKLAKPFWTYLNSYMQEKFNILPGSHECATLYLDTHNFDVFQAGLTLRDRPSAVTSDGEQFGDEISVKSRNPGFIEYAKRLTANLCPRQDMSAFTPYVRNEIVENHAHRRDDCKYTYSDLPPRIQAALEAGVGPQCRKMEYWPQVMSIVQPRHRYTVLLDPHDACNFILPAPAEGGELKSDKHVCVEVAMDKCEHRLPTRGMPISDIFATASTEPRRFPFLGADYLAEREFKPELSGRGVTDEMMTAAYTRLAMFFYDLAKPFEKEGQSEPPIYAVRSKATRGIAAKASHYPHLVPDNILSRCQCIP